MQKAKLATLKRNLRKSKKREQKGANLAPAVRLATLKKKNNTKGQSDTVRMISILKANLAPKYCDQSVLAII